jgi:NADPH:quinone reductase-like Zn-dependent oxidoreductase
LPVVLPVYILVLWWLCANAGVIAAVGPGVTSLSVGQAVACNGAAAFSEYGITQAHMCSPVQQATPEVVALTLSAVTAAAALEHTAKVQPGEVVLVTAAAGGTGHFAVQLAQLAGGRVVAVAGSEQKKQKLQALGLERVINYKQEVRAWGLGAGTGEGSCKFWQHMSTVISRPKQQPCD